MHAVFLGSRGTSVQPLAKAPALHDGEGDTLGVEYGLTHGSRLSLPGTLSLMSHFLDVTYSRRCAKIQSRPCDGFLGRHNALYKMDKVELMWAI